MKKITDILAEKKFTVSVELIPPRNGADPKEMLEKVTQLKGAVDFVSVTKGAGGSLRGGTLPISYFVHEKLGITVIAHFVCRERTAHEIENDLIDLCYFDVNNILALRGDPPAGSTEGWNGDYKYAYLLVDQIKRMNGGCYLPKAGDTETCHQGIKTDFCIVVAGHPEDTLEDEISHMKAKVDAGAQIIITQLIFTFEDYVDYVTGLRKNGINIPVIAGIRPLISEKQARSIESFFKIKVPDNLMKGLQEKGKEFGIDYFSNMITRLKEYGAAGAHLFILNDIELVNDLLKKTRL